MLRGMRSRIGLQGCGCLRGVMLRVLRKALLHLLQVQCLLRRCIRYIVHMRLPTLRLLLLRVLGQALWSIMLFLRALLGLLRWALLLIALRGFLRLALLLCALLGFLGLALFLLALPGFLRLALLLLALLRFLGLSLFLLALPGFLRLALFLFALLCFLRLALFLFALLYFLRLALFLLALHEVTLMFLGRLHLQSAQRVGLPRLFHLRQLRVFAHPR
ncbi:hypothetical protein A6R73_16985, partial [Xanthomonas translucens pv. poae]